MITWYKRYVDDDTRYTRFITPGPRGARDVSDYRVSGVS